MDKKLYDLMDWPEIEAVVYSECKHPLDILGQHITPDGLLFQTFKPGAVGVKVVLTGKNKTYDMEQVDEAGYFALLIPGKRRVAYELIVDYGDGNIQQIKDTYSFRCRFLSRSLSASRRESIMSCTMFWVHIRWRWMVYREFILQCGHLTRGV